MVVPKSRWTFRDASENWTFDREIGWVQSPGLDVEQVHDGRTLRFRTNDDGLTPHTARRERRPGVQRIMIFGDSGVVGTAVLQEETVNARLEGRLRAEGLDVEVYNAGVEGYSTDQSLLLMERLLPLYRPDVVVYALHVNDFGGIVTGVAYGNPKPHLLFGSGGQLELVPPDFEREEVISRRGSGLRDLIQRSAVYRLAQPLLYSLRASAGAWEEELLIGVDNDRPHYDREALERLDWTLLRALIDRMRQAASAQGAELLVYMHPELTAVWNPFVEQIVERKGIDGASYDREALERRLGRVAGEVGVPLAPMVPGFLEVQERGPFHLLPRDYHCNPVGYEITAELLQKSLAEAGWLRAPAATARIRPRFER